MVDGFEPKSKTVYQYYGCKFHGCPCKNDRTAQDMCRHKETLEMEDNIKNLGYHVISVWECKKPKTVRKLKEKQFTPYPYFIVYDFEAMLKKLNQTRTEDLKFESLHVPISYAVNDNLTNIPSFSENSNPEQLIKDFVEDLSKRREAIIKKVWEMYPMKDKESLSKAVVNKWKEWVEQVPVLSFNGSNYDINMIKEHFVKTLADMNTVNVAKKENSYMFLMTPQFKFLDVKNYLKSRNFREDKFSRILRILSKFAKLNPCEIFPNG